MSGPGGGFHTLTVAEVTRLCADAVAVTFAVPTELRDLFAFRPGQYLTLRRFVRRGRLVHRDQSGSGGHPTEERRCYSICAPAGAPPRVGVRRIDGGLFSTWLTGTARPGDRVDVAPPAGSFTPEPRPGEHHGLIAAGSGITPVLSIAASTLALHPDTRVTLVYGNRRTETVMFAEELADLKDRYGPRLHLMHVLSREPREAEIFFGRLDRAKLHELLTRLVDTAGVDHWWLCGPLGVAEAARGVLAGLGVPTQRVHRELFHVDEPPPTLCHRDRPAPRPGTTSEVTVIHGGRSTTVPLPRDEPVLDAGQRVRRDLPFACRGGVCGTCRARITEGEARMRRNFALEDTELVSGYVLTCQALPVSDTLTVDYDA